jgi:predicted kinase
MHDMKVYVMIGLIGSGKSSWARMTAGSNFNTVRVSSDDIRNMIKQNYVFDFQLEPLIADMQMALVKEALLAGKTVVIDDCNLTKDGRLQLCEKIYAIPKLEPIEIVYVWVECNRDLALSRRLKNLRGQPEVVWKWVMEKHEAMFDLPNKKENKYVTDMIKVDNESIRTGL